MKCESESESEAVVSGVSEIVSKLRAAFRSAEAGLVAREDALQRQLARQEREKQSIAELRELERIEMIDLRAELEAARAKAMATEERLEKLREEKEREISELKRRRDETEAERWKRIHAEMDERIPAAETDAAELPNDSPIDGGEESGLEPFEDQQQFKKRRCDMDSEQPQNRTEPGLEKPERKRFTICKEISKLRAKRLKKQIEVNVFGQPIGKSAPKFETYIGFLARNMVPITYATWWLVPEHIKNVLNDDVQISFETVQKTLISTHIVFASAAKKWKDWKSKLTSAVVYNEEYHQRHPDWRVVPPNMGHSKITPSEWHEFVNVREKPGFLKMRKSQQERRRQMKYPHTSARKSLARLEAELQSQRRDNKAIERHELWKASRTKKGGQFVNDGAKTVANKIDELGVMRGEGKFVEVGSHDILTEALGTPERSGSVRAKGAYVTLTQLFKRQTPGYKTAQQNNQMWQARVNEIVEKTEKRFAILEALLRAKNMSATPPPKRPMDTEQPQEPEPQQPNEPKQAKIEVIELD